VAYWAEQTFKAVQRIEKRTQVPGLVPSKAIKPSWAAVASRPHPGVAREGLALRQVKVHVADTTERQALWTTPNNTILQRVLQGAKGAGVVGVKKLPSGDVVIQTKDRAGRESLAQRSAWLEGVAPSARVIADLYPVMVHGCRLSNVKTTDQQEAIKSLIDQNRNLHPGLPIRRVAWPRGAHSSGKRFSSLTVFVTTPEWANRVISRGFVEGGEVKDVVKFHTGCGLVQCFKCCGYGHIAKNCQLLASCGHCAQTHETRECQQKDKSQCTNCTRGGRSDRGHKAWSESCYYRR
jgi:hypothetical protein